MTPHTSAARPSAVAPSAISEERMLLQRARLRSLQPRFPDIRLFHGTEADILADGSIDFGDAFLEKFIQLSFRLPVSSNEKQAQRFIDSLILEKPKAEAEIKAAPHVDPVAQHDARRDTARGMR